MENIKYIIAFIRPWDTVFFMNLSRGLKSLVGQNNIKIRYITMWKESQSYIKKNDQEEVFYIPDLLSAVETTDDLLSKLVQIENSLLPITKTPLNLMLHAERFKPKDSKKSTDFIYRHLSVLEKLIPDNSILFSSAIDHFCYWLACDLARSRNGYYFGFCASGRPSDKTQILSNATDLWTPYSATEEHYIQIKNQYNEIINGVKPSYMNVSTSHIKLRKKISNKIQHFIESKNDNYFSNHNINSLLFEKPSKTKEKIKWLFTHHIIKFIKIEEIDYNFIYLPLHFEPEASTLVYSPFFHDQSYWIESVSKSLPLDVKLVIKENPKMWGKRNLSFYKRAERNPNIVWIDPSTPSEILLNKCSAVITLTGTVAIEAMLLKKPVAIFGNTPYSSVINSIPRIDKLTEIPQMISQLIKQDSTKLQDRFMDEYAIYIANLVPNSFIPKTPNKELTHPSINYSNEYAQFIIDSINTTN